MKYLLSLFVVLVTLSVSAQDVKTVFKKIGKNNVTALQDLIADEIELSILDDQDLVSKSEALEKLKVFLSSIGAKSCSQLHEGSSQNNSSAYLVGKLNTSNGEDYRVFVYYENKQIIEMRIDKS